METKTDFSTLERLDPKIRAHNWMIRRLKEAGTGYAFLSSNIIGFLTFTLIPVFACFIIAFLRWDGLTTPQFVGLSNFVKLLGLHWTGFTAGHWWPLKAVTPQYWYYLYNTFFFMLKIPIAMGVSLALALAMNQKLKGIVIFRVVYYLPVVSPLVAVALLWKWLYNPDVGMINVFLHNVLRIPEGMLPKWLLDTKWARPSVMIMDIWKGAGYNMLLYLAALQGVPQHLYEAARIDGANKWDQFVNVTWPMLGPANFFILIMSVISGFQTFGTVYIMTNGGPAGATTTIVYFIYRNAYEWFKMGIASGVAWTLFVMMFIATLFQFKYAGEKVHYV